MKSVLAIVLCVLLGQAAQAKVYECVMLENVDPWSGPVEGQDNWRAYIDEATGIAELQSENSIFGENPFAVLKRASASGGIVAGLQYYGGVNRYEPDTSYVIKFDKANRTAYFETREGKRSLELDHFECRPIAGKIPRD